MSDSINNFDGSVNKQNIIKNLQKNIIKHAKGNGWEVNKINDKQIEIIMNNEISVRELCELMRH